MTGWMLLGQTSVESVLQVGWRIPLWVIVLLALLCGGLVLALYTAERGRAGKPVRWLLAAIRFTLLMSILWMLAGWSWLRFKSDPPELAIVLDRSASMSTPDVGEGSQGTRQTRFERALDIFEQRNSRQRERLRERYRLQWYTLAETLEPVAVDFAEPGHKLLPGVAADGTQSRLGDGLSRLLERQAGKGTAAIILASDGINTAGAALSDVAKRARRAAVPFYTLTLGRQDELPDLRLADLLLDRAVYLGDRVTVEVSVIASHVPAAETRVVLRDTATEKILDETRVALSGEQRPANPRLSFVPDRPGDISLRIEASAVEGETELANNRLDAVVNVQDKTLRVMLVSGGPSYEFRFLKSFLQRATQAGQGAAASFELHSVLQNADPGYVEQDPTALRLVPSDPEAVLEYDVFVLLDFDPQLVSQSSQQAIVEAVTQAGAGCLFIYGSGSPRQQLQGWPLAKLLPLERGEPERMVGTWQGGSLAWQPTALGSTALPMQLAASVQESLGVWQRLPEFASLGRVEQVNTAAQVLAEAVDRLSGQRTPLLVTQFAGAGRTALQASDETYRWTSFAGSDVYYQRYWGQLIRWLSYGKLHGSAEKVELLVDPKQARFGQPLRIQVTLGGAAASTAGETVEVIVEGNYARQQTLKLPRVGHTSNVYQGLIEDLSPGSYRARLLQPALESPPSEDFAIAAPPGEQASLRANVEGMQLLAEQSRGHFYLDEDAQRLFDELPAGKPTRLGTLPSRPMWNAWWVAALFVILISVEWIVRRTYQML